jgi:hypothetical protein
VILKKPNRSNVVFLISWVQVIRSSKFLCPSPIIRGVLWGVDTNILKIRSPRLEIWGKQNWSVRVFLNHPLRHLRFDASISFQKIFLHVTWNVTKVYQGMHAVNLKTKLPRRFYLHCMHEKYPRSGLKLSLLVPFLKLEWTLIFELPELKLRREQWQDYGLDLN